MITRCCAVLLCLTGMAHLCLADGYVPGRKYQIKNSYTTPPAKTKTFECGPFKMQAEELEMRVTREDQYFINLKGDARMVCGQTQFSADQIMISCKGERDQQILLEGNVEIQNERDQLQMTGQRATLKSVDRFLTLQSRKAGQVTLQRTQDQKTTEISASHIMLKYKDLQTLLIKPIENITIDERPANSADRVDVEADQPSEFDFFDGVAVTEMKIYAEDPALQAKKP